MGILLGASTGNEFLPTKYLSAVETGDGNESVLISL